MKLLVDANLSPRVAAALRASGHEAVHVGDVDPLTASDDEIPAAGAIVSLSPSSLRIRDLPVE